MTRELRRIQRLRDLRSHKERAAERELAAARRAVVEAEATLREAEHSYLGAIDAAQALVEVAAPDFEMERLRVAALAKKVERAESALTAAREARETRSELLSVAHREVEQMNRWADITREVARADEQRLDRVSSDETAARLRSKS
jgi:flagellar biosynthesis chaperone FliJ